MILALMVGFSCCRAPDKDGRIQYVAQVPVEQLPSGNYSVRFIVKQGNETADETVTFVLE
jgi:hypothetical protein